MYDKFKSMKEKELVQEEKGHLIYDPQNPESINAVLKIITQSAQVAGFNYGANEINYAKGLKEGKKIGFCYGVSAGLLAMGLVVYVISKKRR